MVKFLVLIYQDDFLKWWFIFQPCKDAIVQFLDKNILSVLGLALSITVLVVS